MVVFVAKITDVCMVAMVTYVPWLQWLLTSQLFFWLPWLPELQMFLCLPLLLWFTTVTNVLRSVHRYYLVTQVTFCKGGT
jgi:hypothetical protein